MYAYSFYYSFHCQVNLPDSYFVDDNYWHSVHNSGLFDEDVGNVLLMVESSYRWVNQGRLFRQVKSTMMNLIQNQSHLYLFQYQALDYFRVWPRDHPATLLNLLSLLFHVLFLLKFLLSFSIFMQALCIHVVIKIKKTIKVVLNHLHLIQCFRPIEEVHQKARNH